MADDVRGPAGTDGVDHRGEVLREPLQRVPARAARRARGAGSADVVGHDVITAFQALDDLVPEARGVGEAVDEHDRWRGVVPVFPDGELDATRGDPALGRHAGSTDGGQILNAFQMSRLDRFTRCSSVARLRTLAKESWVVVRAAGLCR